MIPATIARVSWLLFLIWAAVRMRDTIAPLYAVATATLASLG